MPALFHPGHLGIWWAIVCASVVHGVWTTLWFQRGKWKLKQV